MFQLINPISLFAAAGIIIPVLIHLWDKRKGKVRKIGSIQLLTESAHSQARRLRLTDLWLLLLRCLLIITIAFLLAQPVWLHKSEKKGWVLIEPSSVSTIYHAFHTTIDSLLQAGFECHSFDTSFAILNINKARTDSIKSEASLPYWSLITLLDRKVPADLPLYLFTGRELQRFQGDRPQAALNLHWQTMATTDSSDAIIAYEQTPGNGIVQVQLHSKPGSAYYTRNATNQNIPVRNSTMPLMDTGTIHVLVYADHSTDKRYLEAALQAIETQTHLLIDIQEVTNSNEPTKGDWLFWLSEKQVPSTVQAQHQFLYAAGNVKDEPGILTAANVFEQQAQVSKIIIPTRQQDLEPVWTDSKGRMVLGNSNTSYYFFSRLRPGWNSLVWNESFAEALFTLLRKEQNHSFNDSRAIDPSEILPAKGAGNKALATQGLVQKTDLRLYFWLLAFILFAFERMISFQRSKKEGYGT